MILKCKVQIVFEKKKHIGAFNRRKVRIDERGGDREEKAPERREPDGG
ncbi:MAG: hypothetical protein II951_02190 [Bacteroidales bacterium]|nr:hypothetical protein [Bacteroidales bacterium]